LSIFFRNPSRVLSNFPSPTIAQVGTLSVPDPDSRIRVLESKIGKDFPAERFRALTADTVVSCFALLIKDTKSVQDSFYPVLNPR
jgi:hypothetical protein